jgi:hypothetical protein
VRYLETKICYNAGTRMDTSLDCIVDLEHVQAISKSHLGDDFTMLHMSNGERITIKKTYNEVKADFVRKLYREGNA